MGMGSFSLADMIERNARIAGDRIAVSDGDGSRTFARFRTETERLAAGLARRGLGRGDRVAILALNHAGFLTILGAAATLGAIVVPVNRRLADEEIGHVFSDCDPAMVFADAAHADRARKLAPGRPPQRIEALSDLFDEAPPPRTEIGDDDPVCIIHTAAVAGKPRGAVLTHGNLVAANLQTIAAMGLNADDRYLNMLPMFHITGINLALAVMHAGGRNAILEKFDEREVVERTAAEGITVWGSFPPMLARLDAVLAEEKADVSSLRIVLGIDGPDTIRPFEERTGAAFWMLYGQTETGGLVTLGPAMEKPGSAGRQGALTRFRLVDDAENEVATGETGEIAVRGPLVFQGFWKRPEDNRHIFRGGWHHTGDLGALDADGYLFFKGRKPEKELIKPGGENVYPAEVEAVILEHPDVVEVSVIGVPDSVFGEGIKAVCVLRKGASLEPEALAEFVASRIARYKKPRYAAFVPELPKTADGKIDRAAVKAAHGGS
jgi:acyl-CoA synthetase (AMP-forming)/AMP-acid ligase II